MKTALTFLALIAFKVAAFAGVDLGVPSSYTPYERYMAPVRNVMASLPKQKPSMDQVCQLMRQGRAFRYHLDDPYLPASPEVTARIREGDCKDKALWLCNQLDSSARFVIGKTARGARISHAWVLWENEGRWWILDCTLKNAPVLADSVAKDRYVPLYSYGKGSCYRHMDTQLNVARVAGKAGKPAVAVAGKPTTAAVSVKK
jgi:hypothetical protein